MNERILYNFRPNSIKHPKWGLDSAQVLSENLLLLEVLQRKPYG